MAVLLYKLRGVPEDEIAGIRQLLDDNGIVFYETDNGNWGISMPAIWLNDKTQLHHAKELIEKFQQQRKVNARIEYEKLKSNKEIENIFQKIRRNPVEFILILAAIGFILYVSIFPFFNIGK